MRAAGGFLADVNAVCRDCDWECGSRNAMAVGARHAEHHDHEVRVEESRVTIFNIKERSAAPES